MRIRWIVVLSILCLGPATSVFAQTFPADNAWIAFPCGNGPMVDAVRDQSGAFDERDIVGNRAAPAGFRAVDSQFLYLRLRVEKDPTKGPNLQPFAWGFAFSVDVLEVNYEILVTLDGAAKTVAVYRN